MRPRHEHWGSKLGFILASGGSAIGLGSLWRFPFIAGKGGGGAFVLLYLLFTLLIALPTFIGELLIGRATQTSSVLAFETLSKKSGWRALGWLSLSTTFLILSYYNVVAGWCLNYALMSLTEFTLGKTPEEIQNTFTLLYEAGDINIFWLILFIALNAGVVACGVRKGIERWSRILMPVLFVLLIGLFFFAMTLPGFPEAFRFIFAPDFSKLTASNILMALGMALFTISVGLGINITYGSYLRPGESIPKTACIVTLMTVLVSLIAALVIFPIVFTYNVPPQGGPGLIFKTMPLLFSQLPGSILLSTLFFLLVVFAALTSTIALLEVLVANAMEVFEWQRKKAIALVAIAIFIMGIPSALAGSNTLFRLWPSIYGKTFFATMDELTANWLMPIAALLGTLFMGWVYDKRALQTEYLQGMPARSCYGVWFFCVRYLAPLAVLLIILQKAGLF